MFTVPSFFFYQLSNGLLKNILVLLSAMITFLRAHFYCIEMHLNLVLFPFEAGAISIHSPQRSFTRSVQDNVFFSVDITCSGIPTIQWTFMSGAVSRTIGTWQPGVYTNITVDYSSRVQSYNNGSISLSDLRLQDSGFYVVTVTDASGSSKDTGFVLKVNGELELGLLVGELHCFVFLNKSLFLQRQPGV